MQDHCRLFCPKKYVGGRHFIKQVQVKQTRIAFQEVVSTCEIYGEKWSISRAQNFSGALRNTGKSSRKLCGTVSGPEKFSGLLRNARLISMTPVWDKVPIRYQNHNLPNTRWALYPLSYENSWRARSLYWVHMWQTSCILIGSALLKSSWSEISE